ncbi:hypothetical protein [Alkalihalobacillus pseudalcaliphilus]|uniref:hypothetical protein n=1 Tax=Alkalihalobacillus pseudalcaliphilus TaxID=79884 RepID=UPI000ABC96B0|nr:hypothetical protein [Alkalihalobacillus pseudalcaliphilus]
MGFSPFFSINQISLVDEDTAFFWIEKKRSWLGLWEGEESKIPYQPSIKHVAFRLEYSNMKKAIVVTF